MLCDENWASNVLFNAHRSTLRLNWIHMHVPNGLLVVVLEALVVVVQGTEKQTSQTQKMKYRKPSDFVSEVYQYSQS